MARKKMKKELPVTRKARQAAENRKKGGKDGKAKAAEEARNKADSKAKQVELNNKSAHKRKEQPMQPEKAISIHDPTRQTPTKKAKVTDKGKGKAKVVHPEPSEYDSDDPLGPEAGDIWVSHSQRRYVEDEPVEENPSIGITGHPRKELGSVPTSYKDKPIRQAGATRQPKKTWEEILKGKGFKPERFIKASAFNEDSQVIKVLRKRELGVWMEKGKGYKQGIVRNFYTVAIKDINSDTVTAKMSSKKTVKVTPDLIAKYLKIERPLVCEIGYPRDNFVSPGRLETMKLIYSNSTPPKDDGQRYPIGYMNPEFATMNKIIHSNLYARGSEGASKQAEVNLLVEFMGDAIIDVAAWIFEDIVLYITERANRLMPFPHMITQLCIDQGVTSPESYSFGEGGIFPSSSSMGPRARAEAARTAQTIHGMKARGTYSSCTPQYVPRVTTVQEMIESIQSQQKSLDDRMQTLESRIYTDMQTMHHDISRILHRQDIQWTIQMVLYKNLEHICRTSGAEPFPPVPSEYFREFGYLIPSTPQAADGVGKEGENAVEGEDEERTVADVNVEPGIPPK